MTAKIFRGIFITAVGVLLVSVAMVFALCFKNYNDKTVSELKHSADYISAGYASSGLPYLDMISDDGIGVVLLYEDGAVLYGEQNVNGKELLAREDVAAALTDVGEGTSKHKSHSGTGVDICYSRKLPDGTVLILEAPRYSAASMLGEMLTPIVSLITIVLVITFIVAFKLSVAVIEPINELDLDHPEKNKSSIELKPIIDKLSSQKYRISHQMAELRSRENEFNNLTENMNVGMIVINAKTEIISSNKSARLIFGIKDEAPVSVLSVKNTNGFKEAIKEALSGRRGFDYIRTDEKYYSIVVTPVEHDGIIDGAVVVAVDDTEKEHRETLRREFTSNVSHELKTPLTSISGFAELIRSGLTSGDDSVHFADNIYKEAQRLITLVGDIIRLNQLDGKEIPYDGEINLFEVADEAVERLENVAQKKQVQIILEGKEAKVLGTYLILEEIIYNLLDNAIKYNKEGGKVYITVSDIDGRAMLCVRDTGIGIPADKQDRVFERFYRVDKSHSKKIGGTGLGLSIVKHAILYHKASINLESEEGVGTAVTIVFPPIQQ